LKTSGKAGDISDETIISQNERPTRKTRFDSDEDIMAIDDKIVSTYLIG
jgi:hypothetical protein